MRTGTLWSACGEKRGVLLVTKEALEHIGTYRFVLYRICDVSHPLKVHLVLFNELCGKSRNLWISVINFCLSPGPKLILPVDSGGFIQGLVFESLLWTPGAHIWGVVSETLHVVQPWIARQVGMEYLVSKSSESGRVVGW